MKPILEVHNVGKRYRIRHVPGGYLSLRDRISGIFQGAKNTSEDFWALRDVTFSLQAGESLGIIGRNGAGKSTLLKILSKITHPTAGKLIKRGRIASLLEVGTGFHPELTGRENIFFNGSLLGMKRREIQAKFDEIVDFSGTERFLDTPLKHFSSGMQLRLAFAVAAFLEPEILVIDEVLAVGDAEFQKKCMGKMEDISKSGRTILFVSHNMAAIQNLCKTAILVEQGRVKAEGFVNNVLRIYNESFSGREGGRWTRSKAAPEHDLYAEELSVELNGSQPRHSLKIILSLKSASSHPGAFVAFDIANGAGVAVMQALPVTEPFIYFEPGGQRLEFEIQLPPLIPDLYSLSFWIGPHNTDTFDQDHDVASFEILESPTRGRSFPHSSDHGFVAPVSALVKHEVFQYANP